PADLRMDYFIVNNPYPECMSYLPTNRPLPKCIVSSRTYPEFVRQYRQRKGAIYKYNPSRERKFGGVADSIYCVDDYRNPICAAVGLAYRFGAEKLLVF